MILPALSLTQPWCDLVLDHGKDIENRTWACHKRGVFLIHASAGMTFRQYAAACDFAANATRRPVDTSLGLRYLPDEIWRKDPIVLAEPRKVVRGGLLGAAEIIDVVPPNRRANGGTGVGRHLMAGNPWLMDGCFGFVLGRRVRLPFRAMNGRQRWFNVELTAAEEATLRSAGLVSS